MSADPLPYVVHPTFANGKDGEFSVILDMLPEKTWGDSPRDRRSPQLDFYNQLANWLRLLVVQCSFSSVRGTEAEDVAFHFGTCGLTGFN